MIFGTGIGGSTASQPTDERPPNDPEKGSSGSSHFAAPAAWSAWNQPQPDPAVLMAQEQSRMGQDASGGMGRSNHPSPLYETLIQGPGGSPVNPASLSQNTQAAIQSNDQFARGYVSQQQQARGALMDALGTLAQMSTFTNPFSGQSSTGRVTTGS